MIQRSVLSDGRAQGTLLAPCNWALPLALESATAWKPPPSPSR